MKIKHIEKLTLIKQKNSRFIYFFTLIFFTFKLFIFIFYKSPLYTFKNSWSFSEYFINYSGGFVRRGLIGELLQNISELTSFFHKSEKINSILTEVSIEYSFVNYEDIKANLSLVGISFIIGLISFIHILYFLFKVLKSYSIINQILFLIAPFGFIFFLNNIDSFFGRKDLLIVNIIIYYYEKKKIFKKADLTKFFFIGIFLILSYEIFIFFIPIFWVLIFLQNKNYLFLKVIIFLNLIFLNLSLIFKFSTTKDFYSFKLLCDDIYIRRISLRLDELQCWGAPRYLDSRLNLLESNYSKFFSEVSIGLSISYKFWILIFLILLLIIFLFNLFNLKGFFILSPMVGLFIIAQDYGRWLFLVFITIVLFGEEPKYQVKRKNLIIALMVILSGVVIEVPIYLNEGSFYFRF